MHLLTRPQKVGPFGKKPMCTNPITHDGQTFACRVCNDCLTARKNDWVARACAEKASTKGETLVMRLSYRNNPDGSKPSEAEVFHYDNVQTFIKRLRQQYKRTYKTDGEIRYICAGEFGSQTHRVHWHIVIFADREISTLGKWTDGRYRPMDQMRLDYDCHWSMWDHGMVHVQVPDQGGMSYVLKYALKDQFNVVKSKGTMRETKAENFGAGMFRMSKQPPIGFRWLEQQCDRWEQMLVVPPRLELKIPEYSGFWWPQGLLREYLLERLHQINQRCNEIKGTDCPQWSTLLATVEDQVKDYEDLVYGTPDQEEEEFDAGAWLQHLEREQRTRAQSHKHAKVRNRCGGVRVCRLCWAGSFRERRKDFKDWFHDQKAQYYASGQSEHISFAKWFRNQRQTNPFCFLHDDADTRAACEA